MIFRNERGIAIVTAVVAATIVALLAAAALNISMGRFQLATAQVTRRAAFYASEAGIRYGFARLDADNQSDGNCNTPPPNGIKDITECRVSRTYIISSKPVGTVINGCGTTGQTVDEQKTDLKMGSYDVTVFVIYQPPNPPSQPAKRWKVCAVAQ